MLTKPLALSLKSMIKTEIRDGTKASSFQELRKNFSAEELE